MGETVNPEFDQATMQAERERLAKKADPPVQQLIDEAIARGVNPKEEREPQAYQTVPDSYLDAPVARDTTEPRKVYPLKWMGDLEFKRVIRYENEQESFLIRRVEAEKSLMITSLVKEEFVRGNIRVDEFGEPQYLILCPAGWSQPTKLLWSIKLHGDLFTEEQYRSWIKEWRSKKISGLEAEVESLKAQHKRDLEAAEQKIQELTKANDALIRDRDLSIHDKLKKLLSHEKTEETSTG